MCELLGASCSRERLFARELTEFRRRGGLAADNPDGWGLAWRNASGFELAKEAQPACASRRFAELGNAVHSDLLIAHVRKARFPRVNSHENTHPFRHQCCNRTWIFAHNGLVPEVVDLERVRDDAVCRPTGETDSEYAFCHLLGRIAERLAPYSSPESPAALAELAAISERIAGLGKFNFLLSDGAYLIAYGHDRLHHRTFSEDGAVASVVATEPLPDWTDWTAFLPGELRIYHRGHLAGRNANSTGSTGPAGHAVALS